MAFPNPGDVMREFAHWIGENTTGRPMFVSDNDGFDWQFVNWYFHAFLGENPSRPPLKGRWAAPPEPVIVTQKASPVRGREVMAELSSVSTRTRAEAPFVPLEPT